MRAILSSEGRYANLNPTIVKSESIICDHKSKCGAGVLSVLFEVFEYTLSTRTLNEKRVQSAQRFSIPPCFIDIYTALVFP